MEVSHIFIFFLLMLCHIIADFNVQIGGHLHRFKSKGWWKENVPNWEKYHHDYKCAMIIHSFCWAAITFLPLLLMSSTKEITVQANYVMAVAVNTPIHYIVDDLKANKGKLTLLVDQILHVLQIITTLGVIVVLKRVQNG